MYNSRIVGMGHYVPDNIVTNDDLSQLMDTSDEWIQERTGIKQRRWALKGDGNTTFSMGLKAAEQAIKNADIDRQDIDFIVFATLSPDYYFPGPGLGSKSSKKKKPIAFLEALYCFFKESFLSSKFSIIKSAILTLFISFFI